MAEAAIGSLPGRTRTSAFVVVVVPVLVLAWLACTAWARPLMLPDEGRYVGVAWEMLRSGDWLTPTLNGLPYFHKPPLFYWITAASLWVFGLNDGAARAAPILGAGAAAVAMWLFAERWSGAQTGRLTLLALLAQPLLFLGGQFANLDMLVAGCITVTVALLAHAALCIAHQRPYRSALAAAYAAAALGVLAKGLIGVVIPLLVVGTWLLLLRRWRVMAGLIWLPGMALFAVVAVPWFVCMELRFAGFLDYFFVFHHFRRFASADFNNVQPFWFFPVVLMVASLPLLPWLMRAIQGLWQGRADLQPGPLQRGGQPVRALLAVWVAVVVLFFSLPASKLVGYVLPAVPPLAMLAADGYALARAARPLRQRRTRLLWVAGLAFAAVLGIATVATLALRPERSTRAVAKALLNLHAPGEPVAMLGHYYFDLPFYARLATPVDVVDDWAGARVSRRDDWRKELSDAARFAGATAQATLVAPADFARRLCAAPVSWLVGDAAAVQAYPYLALAERAATGKDGSLWRLQRDLPATRAALACAPPPAAAAGAR